jgi:hypothetical protein
MRRRQFLQAGAAVLPGVSMWSAQLRAAVQVPKTSCILLMLVGGPSQLDTWDMKPEAPSDIRGPFRPIKTNVPGIEISEIFPRMARHADKYALIRSVWHDGPSLHDSGSRFMQTGRPFPGDVDHPHFGAVLSHATGRRSVILPYLTGNTGSGTPDGQSAGFLGSRFEPEVITRSNFDLRCEPEGRRARYGSNSFGQSCLMACRLMEAGTRFVTVNMFGTVFGETTWDIHGYAPFSPISCYRDHVGPIFDAAYSSLLEDLSERGLLDSTLVIAMGEFGRTPKINPAGGRDHWPGCSTVVMAGGGVRGGQVCGSSDRLGAEPKDDPVHPGMVAATVYTALGVPLEFKLEGPGGISVPVVEPGTQPIRGLL